MKIAIVLLAALLSLAPTLSAQTLLHDVSADSILSLYAKSPVGFPVAQRARFTNRGSSDETNINVAFVTRDRFGIIVFRDTVFIPTLLIGQSIDQNFNAFTPLINGVTTCCAIILTRDLNSSNDSMCATTIVCFDPDFKGISVDYPKQGDSISFGSVFNPIATFRNVGVKDGVFPPRVEIRRCDTRQLVFVLDTSGLDTLKVDSSVTITFGSRQGAYDIKNLAPGCYLLEAVSLSNEDGDRSNNTAFSTFTIYTNHDISADSILGLPVTRIPSGKPVTVRGRFTNKAITDEPTVTVIGTVRNNWNTKYADTLKVSNWLHGQTRDVSFKDWTPDSAGIFDVCISALVANDEIETNNTICKYLNVANTNDAQGVRILSPDSGTSIRYGQPFRVVASFRNTGLGDLFGIPLRLEIRSCSDRSLKFKFDTVATEIRPDSTLLIDTFGSRQANYDNSTLEPGCYQLAAIARYPGDENRMDDTAFSTIIIGAKSNAEIPTAAQIFTARIAPNPSAGIANLFVTLPTQAPLSVAIYDVTGQRVTSLEYPTMGSGEHIVPLDISHLPNGAYQLVTHVGGERSVTKVTVLH